MRLCDACKARVMVRPQHSRAAMRTHLNTDEPEALTINRFMSRYDVGRTTTYDLIKQGKLDARKLGGRTLIMAASARALFESLPRLQAAA